MSSLNAHYHGLAIGDTWNSADPHSDSVPRASACARTQSNRKTITDFSALSTVIALSPTRNLPQACRFTVDRCRKLPPDTTNVPVVTERKRFMRGLGGAFFRRVI